MMCLGQACLQALQTHSEYTLQKRWATGHLGIDDMPCIRNKELILPGERSVAGARRSKGDHADVSQPQLLGDVKCC